MEELEKGKRESVTGDCDLDVRATLLRSRAASNAGVGRQSPLACGIEACLSHVTLAVMLARLLVLRSSSQFLRKREAARSLRYAPSHSSVDRNTIEKGSCSWHDMRGATYTRKVFNTKKNPYSLISFDTLIHLLHTILYSSPFILMVSFFHTHEDGLQ